MVCRNCGNENKPDARFCLFCGMRMGAPGTAPTAMPAAAFTPAAPKKRRKKIKFSGKKLAVVLGALALIAVVLLVSDYLHSLRDQYFPEGSWQGFSGEIVHNDEKVGTSDYISSSLDGNTIAFKEGDDLCISTSTGVREVDDVDWYILAKSGKAVAYTKDDGLYHYSCQTRKSKKIAGDVLGYRISPNGKFVLYTMEEALHLWDGKSSVRLAYGENTAFTLWSVSDKGVVYAVNVEDHENDVGTLYSFTPSGEMSVVAEQVDSSANKINNRSHSQVAFYAQGGCYFSEDGAAAQKVTMDIDMDRIYGCTIAGAECLNVSDLREQIYLAEGYGTGILFRVKDDLSTQIILEDVVECKRAYDNSGLFAINAEGTLYKIDPKTGQLDWLAGDAARCYPAGKGAVYFLDVDGILCCNTEDKEIAEDVGSVVGRNDGGILYIDEDGDLYAVGGFGKKTKVDSDVDGAFRGGKYFYYYTDDGNVYVSPNGKRFERISGIKR